jgi:penicillin-binding protein 2
MRRDIEWQRVFTRRAALLGGAKALLFGVLGGRLYYLQAMEAERYVTLAEDNRINLLLVAPPRGHIFDRRGRALAVNRQDYRVLIVAEQSPDVAATIASLERLVPVAETDWRRVLKETRVKRKFVPVNVVENLTWDDVARVEVNALDLPGISVEEGFSRLYPHGAPLSHVLGYVGPVAPGENKDDPLLDLPGFRIGKSGVE